MYTKLSKIACSQLVHVSVKGERGKVKERWELTEDQLLCVYVCACVCVCVCVCVCERCVVGAD